MAVIVKGYIFTVVRVDAAESDDRPSEISADIFYDSNRVTEIRLCIHVESIFVFSVNMRFHFFKRRAEASFHFIKKSCLKGFAKQCEIEMVDVTPETVIGEAALGNQTMNVRIPFERTAESVENADKAGNKVSGFVQLMKQAKDNTADSTKKTV